MEKDVTKARAMISLRVVDANLPLAAADKMTAAVKIMFSFSKIASSKALFLLHSMLVGT